MSTTTDLSSTSHALVASLSAIAAAILATIIIVLVLITICIIRWRSNKTPASEEEDTYETVELEREVAARRGEEGVGVEEGRGDAYELQINEAYATHMHVQIS